MKVVHSADDEIGGSGGLRHPPHSAKKAIIAALHAARDKIQDERAPTWFARVHWPENAANGRIRGSFSTAPCDIGVAG